MKPAKSRAQALSLTLLLSVVFAAVLISGCKPSPKISVESDPRVFTLFAGLVAADYGRGQADPASETLRTQLKEALAGWTEPLPRLQAVHGLDEIVSAVLGLGPPPDFAIEYESVTGLRGLLGQLWTQVEPLYTSSLEVDAEALAAMADPAAAVIQGAIDTLARDLPARHGESFARALSCLTVPTATGPGRPRGSWWAAPRSPGRLTSPGPLSAS